MTMVLWGLYNEDSEVWLVNRAPLVSVVEASTPVVRQSLSINTQLNSDEYLASANGLYRLYLQGDGNVVLRDWTTRDSLFSTGTHGSGATRLRLQDDGNLVLRTAEGDSVWSSKTHGSGATILQLENSGALVLYAGTSKVWQVNAAPEPTATPAPDTHSCTDTHANAVRTG